jgi:phosphoglycolate phosphatase-like HAD superfamily hydrolase
VLFDIDGTLVRTLGAGVRSMANAFARLHNRVDALETVPVAGRTDLAIVTDAFRRIEIEPTDDLIAAFTATYLQDLPRELTRLSGEGFGILPGVEPLLDAMASASLPVGLLTGNFEAAAQVKLGHFNLWRRFTFGAFGDAHLDRRELVPIALARARAAGIEVGPSATVIVGDTPLDVQCAHAHGATAVAVATGTYSANALARAGADVVLDSLDEWFSRMSSVMRLD